MAVTPFRIGSVPYLNAKPLVDWFHADGCCESAEVSYAVPSLLARQLREGRLDVAIVSSFELFRNPDLRLVPGISIAAHGAVKSVRLFSKVPPQSIRRVALDTSSLTSVNLTRILLAERYGLAPTYVDRPPDLEAMLAECDAGLIIGDLKLFKTPARHILDLGEEWEALTGLPFVYAVWLARDGVDGAALTALLTQARDWGSARLEALSATWSERMMLPLDRVRDYFLRVMEYDLDEEKQRALAEFQARCVQHGLVADALPLRFLESGGDG